MKKRKYFIICVTTLIISSFGCSKHNEAINIVNENNTMEAIKTEDNNNNITFTLMDNTNLSIDRHRINCDVYGTDRCNKWSQDEIDMILNSIKGDWKIKDYVGFVSYSLYFPDLYFPDDNISEKHRNNLLKEYKKVVKSAKNRVPNVRFSIKKIRGEEYPNSNMIFVNDTYRSPIEIIISTEIDNDNYPVNLDQTTVSPDLKAKYPVMYIKFFICYGEELHKHSYEPATLVMTSDKQFYILIDGAFYSLKQLD